MFFFLYYLSKCHRNQKTLYFAPCLYPLKPFWGKVKPDKSLECVSETPLLLLLFWKGSDPRTC